MRWVLIVTLIIGGSVGTGAAEPVETVELIETIEMPSATEPVADELTLSSVNGISLDDDRDKVMGKLGEPEAKERDEWMPELDIYYYSGLQIGFIRQSIYFVDFDISQELVIDGVTVAASVHALKAVLGEPDYVAEDGIVFQRGKALLKLFLNETTGEPEYVSYYPLDSV